MTIPYLMNCPHSDDGWCLECVSAMGREWQEMRDALRNERAMTATEPDDVTCNPERRVMSDTIPCVMCKAPCKTTFPRYIALGSDPNNPQFICADCWAWEVVEGKRNDCPECNGRGRTMEGWPCDDCDGTGRCDL